MHIYNNNFEDVQRPLKTDSCAFGHLSTELFLLLFFSFPISISRLVFAAGQDTQKITLSEKWN